MRLRITTYKLILSFIIAQCIVIPILSQTDPVCSLITDNYSGQITSGRCAPVGLTMEAVYKFMVPVNPGKVQILFKWNDGTSAQTIVNPASEGDTVFRAVQSHVYPPAGNCSYSAEAFVICDGVICSSSSRQVQEFSSWARDNENGGVLRTEPPEALFCEGSDVFVKFKDNSTFNCNINIEPDKPNRLTRWVQFIYGTNTNIGHRIPAVTVVDSTGIVHQMTDASSNSLGIYTGPIIPVPINADAPNQTAFPIIAPAGGVAGDIFEITLRNWNVCNPYDNNPFDGIPPADIINGDNPPIITTALVRIITTPPVVNNSKEDYCAGSAINISVPQVGDVIRWYTDSSKINMVHTGSTFDPTKPPVNLNNLSPGRTRFWVTDAIGLCESAPSKVDVEIFPKPDPVPYAGPNQTVCDTKAILNGSIQTIGIGKWTTPGTSTIINNLDPKTSIKNLANGPNTYLWTVTNGPCNAVSSVVVTSDAQPDPANAGPDQTFCNINNLALNATPVTQGGKGLWSKVLGGGTIINSNDPHSVLNGLTLGNNELAWMVESKYRACITSWDTVNYVVDLSTPPANAGPDRHVCDSSKLNLNGNIPLNGAIGIWALNFGSGLFSDSTLANTSVTGLSEGTNSFIWSVHSALGICSVTKDTMNIIRDLSPNPANAGSDQSLCSVLLSNPLNANLPSKGIGEWQVTSSPTGIAPGFIPSINNNNATVLINAGNEGKYGLAWHIHNGVCSTSDTLTLDFGIVPAPADAGPDQDTCGLKAKLNAVPPITGWGTWTQVSGAGTINFASGIHDPKTKITINTGEEGTYKLEWRIASGSCTINNSNIDTVIVVFKSQPLPPVVIDTNNCGPSSLSINSILNTNATANRWYDSISRGTLLYEGVVYATPVINSDKTIYLSGYNTISQCESQRIPLKININPVPDIPSASNIAHCGPDSFTLVSLPANNASQNRWYIDSMVSAPIHSGLSFRTPLLIASNVYYVSGYDSITRCESGRRQVKAIVHDIPNVPTSANVSNCGTGSVTLTANSGDTMSVVRWYDDPSVAGRIIATGQNYLTRIIDTTQSYWITGYNATTGCESNRIEIKAIINTVPGLPVVNDLASCGPDTLHFISIPGNSGTINKWYDDLASNNLISITNNFNTFLTTGKTYWVASINQITGCEGPKVKVEGTIKAIPVTSIIQGPDVVAVNQTNVVYSILPRSGSQFHWSIPTDVDSILDMENINILGFPSLGIKTISVYETSAGGCDGIPVIKDILVKQDFMIIKAKLDDSATCLNQPIHLSVGINGGTPPFIIQWTGDTQFLSSTDTISPIFMAPTTGVYNLKVSVRDASANYGEDSLIITIHSLPITRLSIKDTNLCSKDIIQLLPINTEGSGIYKQHRWTGNIETLNRSDIQNPLFSSTTKGNFQLVYQVIDSYNCVAVDSMSIQVHAPQAQFNFNNVAACSPVSIQFTNNSVDANTYTWDFGDGTNSSNIESSHLFINEGNGIKFYKIKLNASDSFGCSDTTVQFAQVNPNPRYSISANPQNSCSPANVYITATQGATEYSWTFGDGTTLNSINTVLHTFENNSPSDTTFKIMMVASSYFGCHDTTYTDVIVNAIPHADFAALPLTQMYPDAEVVINNLSDSGNFSYLWDFGDRNYFNGWQPLPHSYLNPGMYSISLKVVGSNCSDSTEQRIFILPHSPLADFNPVSPGCVPLNIQLHNNSLYATNYLWDFGDGDYSNQMNPDHSYYNAGKYIIKLTVNGPGGSDSKIDSIIAYVQPHAFFDLSPKNSFLNEAPVQFFNLSENGAVYNWDFGDGLASNDSSPSHWYTKEGLYNVSLHVISANGCTDEYEKANAINVMASGKIICPNVFSPLSKLDENKIFMPAVIDNVAEYHLMIFNRWGVMVFESFEAEIGWDGTYKNNPAVSDVYMWKIVGKYTNGRSFIKSGDVTLLY